MPRERPVSVLHSVNLGSIYMETLWCFVKVAKATRYLSSGRAQARPVALDTRLPVSYGPEQRYRIPSAMCEITGQWFLVDTTRWRFRLVYEVRY